MLQTLIPLKFRILIFQNQKAFYVVKTNLPNVILLTPQRSSKPRCIKFLSFNLLKALFEGLDE